MRALHETSLHIPTLHNTTLHYTTLHCKTPARHYKTLQDTKRHYKTHHVKWTETLEATGVCMSVSCRVTGVGIPTWCVQDERVV